MSNAALQNGTHFRIPAMRFSERTCYCGVRPKTAQLNYPSRYAAAPRAHLVVDDVARSRRELGLRERVKRPASFSKRLVDEDTAKCGFCGATATTRSSSFVEAPPRALSRIPCKSGRENRSNLDSVKLLAKVAFPTLRHVLNDTPTDTLHLKAAGLNVQPCVIREKTEFINTTEHRLGLESKCLSIMSERSTHDRTDNQYRCIQKRDVDVQLRALRSMSREEVVEDYFGLSRRSYLPACLILPDSSYWPRRHARCGLKPRRACDPARRSGDV